jgi:predicted permease
VTCAGLAARSIALLDRAELGVDGERILGGRIALFEERFPENEQVLAFYARAEERLSQLPGVVAATVTTSLPGTFIGATRFEIEGDDAERPPFANVARVAPSYFATLGVEIASGRDFAAADRAGEEAVAIVNRRFADRLLAGENPLGRRVRFATEDGDAAWLRIVGVAPDLNQDSIDDAVFPTVYLPLAQDVPRFAFLAVRTAGPAGPFKETMRKAVAGIDPDQPLYYLRTLDEWVAQVRWSNRFLAGLFIVFAFAGLGLAAIGVYGMAAYAVAQRTGEIGLRRALGARDRAVVGLVAGRSLRDLAWGLGIGLLLALGLARPVAGMFYGVEAFDLPTFTTVPLVLAAAVVLATLIPARRALGVEPAAALRNE